MHNGKFQCGMAASCTYHQLSSPSSQQESNQKSLTSTKNVGEFIEKKRAGRMDHWQKNDKTERVRDRQKNTRGNKEEESNDSPQISNGGVEVNRNPRLPSWGGKSLGSKQVERSLGSKWGGRSLVQNI